LKSDGQSIQIDLPLAREICRRHAIGAPVWVSEALKGEVNENYLLLLEGGRRWVLRINTEEGDDGKLAREGKTYRWLHQIAPDLPVALDYLSDSSKTLLPADYALIPFLEGRGVGEAIESLPRPKRAALLEEIGRLLQRLHRIRVPFFGNRYDDPRLFPKEASWTNYLEEHFREEVARVERRLGYAPAWKEELTPRFIDFLSALADPVEPVFLHGDFHYDNLLFAETEAGLRISGVFDFEWAWWGDSIADLLHLEEAFFFYPQDQAPFLSGYGGSAWPKEALKVYRILHSLKLISVGHASAPEPDWGLIGRGEDRLRNLAAGTDPF
jgi:aminoglycoside phosphotransferase (APT) family kinase protein